MTLPSQNPELQTPETAKSAEVFQFPRSSGTEQFVFNPAVVIKTVEVRADQGASAEVERILIKMPEIIADIEQMYNERTGGRKVA